MKKLAIYTVLCACFVCPWTALAKAPYYGIATFSDVRPENDKDGTKKLQLAIVITEELGKGGAPLTFYSRFQISQENSKGKVTHRVSIYRGETRIWKEERTRPLEILDYTSDSFNSFCHAYTKGLLPGDIVVFDFQLGGLALGETGGADLWAQLGPKAMWTLNVDRWGPFDLDCP